MLWILYGIAIGFQIGDLITTLIARRYGALESNSLLRDRNRRFVLWKGLLVKAVSAVLILVLYDLSRVTLLMIMLCLAMIAVGVWAVINNLRVIQREKQRA